MKLSLTRSEYKLILLALYLAAEWEDSVADSYGDDSPETPLDPEFAKQRKEALEIRDSFLKLKARLGVRKPMPRQINWR